MTRNGLLRQGWLSLSHDRLMFHNVVLAAGTFGGGILGFLFHSLISHRLRPSDYGAAFAAITLLSLLGGPTAGVGLLATRAVSRSLALGQAGVAASLVRAGNLRLLVVGFAVAGLLAASAPWTSRAIQVPVALIVLTSVAVPFTVAVPVAFGALQGEQRFEMLAFLYVFQAAAKLALALALGLVWGALGVIAGVVAGAVLTYIVAILSLRGFLSAPRVTVDWADTIRYAAVVFPGAIAIILLLSTDIVLVKHFFDSASAGEYSVVSVLGRAIYWGASGVAAVLFPKVVGREARGLRGLPLVLASLVLATLGGVTALLLFTLFAKDILRVFAGTSYVAGSAYLGWYALGMTFLAAATVLVATHQSRGGKGYLWGLIGVTILEPILIVLHHASLLQVTLVVDLTMGLLLLTMLITLVVEERGSRLQPPPTAGLVTR